MTGKDALFERPGAFRAILQKFFIVITFENESVCIAHTFDGEAGGMTQIGEKTNGLVASMKGKSHGIDGVVRDVKRLNGEIADGKLVSGLEKMPVFKFDKRLPAQGGTRLRVAIKWQGMFFQQNRQADHVVDMFVSDKYTFQFLKIDSHRGKPHGNLAGTQPGIDEEFFLADSEQGTISRTATGQNRHA